MIKENKIKRSIEAIHGLLIKVKIMTVNNISHLEIYNLIDDLEYLPQLITDEEDMTNVFDQTLKELCEKYNFSDVIMRYEKE